MIDPGDEVTGWSIMGGADRSQFSDHFRYWRVLSFQDTGL